MARTERKPLKAKLAFQCATNAENLRLLTVFGLTFAFCLFFYLAYYHFWPMVFIVATPLALLVESRHVRWVFPSVAIGTTICWRVVYYFFESFSVSALWLACIYHGLIVALVVGASRWWRRKTKLPLCFVFPVVWIGGEFWRMSGAVGLPLGLLAPPAHEQLWMIQVCDIAGLYTLSFAMAMVGGLIADLLRCWPAFDKGSSWQGIEKPLRVGVISTFAVWLFIAAYGAFRLQQSDAAVTEGPKLAVVQTDVPTRPGVLFGFDPDLLLQDLMSLSAAANATVNKPDLIVWPEAPAGFPALNSDWIESPPTPQPGESLSDTLEFLGFEHGRSTRFYRMIRGWVDREQTPVLLGSTAMSRRGFGSDEGWEKRNAALRFNPQTGQSELRQFKMRLFPAGEYIPGEGWFLHDWLKVILGETGETDRVRWFKAGERRETFQLNDHRYAVSICNEIMYPRESAVFLPEENGRKPVDFVVNLSNNGGFLRNHAMIYHSILLPFRAVEARIGIARSSNTGISGFVKPTGEMYGEVMNEKGERRTGLGAPEMGLIEEVVRIRMEREDELTTNPELLTQFKDKVAEIKRLRLEAGISGQSTQTVWIDARRTLYSRIGDLFGWSCLVALLVAIGGFVWEATLAATKRLQRASPD